MNAAAGEVGSAPGHSGADGKKDRQRELEKKRARGEVSCAECRRLKLKCNKKIPCASCVRRGCHLVCPNGAFSTGEGAKFVLTNSRKLHTKLLEMSQRIGQLEDALNIAQATMDTPNPSQHPLLSKELLNIKSGVDETIQKASTKSEDHPPPVEDGEGEGEMHVTAGLVHLSISEQEKDKFVGRATVEAQLMDLPADGVAANSKAINSQIESGLPAEVVAAVQGFPFMPTDSSGGRRGVHTVLEEHLPSFERATALAEAYLENINWHPRAVQRDQIFEELLPSAYENMKRKGKVNNGQSEASELQKMHALALLFALFACGAAADLTQEPINVEGSLYIYLAKAALNTHSVFDYGASIEVVQALQLVSTYNSISGLPSSMEASWKILSFAMILATSIGLHRDPAVWGLDKKQIQRRRVLFWELNFIDKFKSLGSGRPALFHLREADCKLPDDTEQTVCADGSVREGPFFWRLRLCKEVIGPIAETLSEMRPIKYSEILEFDRKIREFDAAAVEFPGGESGEVSSGSNCIWQTFKDIALLLLHRSFFARVMIKHSDQPLRSPFAPSFLASFACAIKVVRRVKKAHDFSAPLLLRMWPIWSTVLISGIIIGSVAARVKIEQLATAALQDLDVCILLFEGSQKHPVAKRGLPILVHLRERTLRSLSGNSITESAKAETQFSETRQEDEHEDSDLSLLQNGVPFIQADYSRSSRERKMRQSPNMYFQANLLVQGRREMTSTTSAEKLGGPAASVPLDTSTAGTTTNDQIPKAPRDIDMSGLDVSMLMDWLTSDDASTDAELSALDTGMSNPSSMPVNPSMQSTFGPGSGETLPPFPDMTDINPTQSAAWLSQTFGAQAVPAAKFFNLAELFGAEGLEPSSFAPPLPRQPVSGSIPVSSSLPTLEQSLPTDASWPDTLYTGDQFSLDPASVQGPWNGDEQLLMDAWGAQTALEGFDLQFNPGSRSTFF